MAFQYKIYKDKIFKEEDKFLLAVGDKSMTPVRESTEL